jgi:hypothetical protein
MTDLIIDSVASVEAKFEQWGKIRGKLEGFG